MNKLSLSPKQLAALVWNQSSRSGPNGESVEVAWIPGGGAALRNSNEPDGPWLLYTAAEWDAFIGGAMDGEFDLPTVST